MWSSAINFSKLMPQRAERPVPLFERVLKGCTARRPVLLILCIGLLMTGCDLTTVPRDTATEDAVFTSEDGLDLYVNSFYDWLPGAEDVYRGDNLSDYIAVNNVPEYLRPGFYGPNTTGGWSWNDLRNFNYLLENNVDESVDEEIRQHYNGIARFFRAFFYFEKVKRYGDVPWIDRPLEIDDPDLFKPQDAREMVMDHVLEDIDFAIEHIRTETDNSRTRISRDAALALKSRIALFEGTFRKYHTDLGLSGTHEEWLQEAVSAAEQLMQSGNYRVYTGGENPYRALFITDAPNTDEDILALVFGQEQGVTHNANWRFTSSTFGSRPSFVRPFINTYLQIDGTPFTDEPDDETMTFVEEMQGRDERLRQTVRHPGYERIDGGERYGAPPNFDVTRTGYQPIKWALDDADLDDGSHNTNSVAIFRYAEVLLNYAEAKAELGTLTDADWEQTIGELRRRAGIQNGTTALPTSVDGYLQDTYFPDVSDPVLLEVRRERGIELVQENFREYDLIRWGRGALMENEWRGVYVPAANTPMDLHADGDDGIYFYTEEPDNTTPGTQYIDVTGDMTLSEGDSGYLLWLDHREKSWETYKRFRPIPEDAILKNPDLEQNPGWE